MKKLFAMAMIAGLAACGGDDEGDIEELDTIEMQQPAPAGMGADTMGMDTMRMDTMGMDTLGIDTTGTISP